MTTAWHYTTGRNLFGIIADSVIRPSRVFVPRWERPVVWFSTTDTFEPTARKGVYGVTGSNLGWATLDEMNKGDGGLVRLGAATSSLVPWNDFTRRRIRMRPDTWAALEQVAARWDSDPREWLIHIGPMSCRSVDRVEFYDDASDTWGETSRFSKSGELTVPGRVREFFARETMKKVLP